MQVLFLIVIDEITINVNAFALCSRHLRDKLSPTANQIAARCSRGHLSAIWNWWSNYEITITNRRLYYKV